jgi:hypothetical protein
MTPAPVPLTAAPMPVPLVVAHVPIVTLPAAPVPMVLGRAPTQAEVTEPIHLLGILVKADIHGLAEGSASSWDVLHLHTKLLDHLHYRFHHVALVHIKDQDGDDMIWSCCDVRRQHLVHPHDHHCLVHPGSVEG